MMTLLVVFTLICLLMPVYVYAGYPLMLWLLTRRRPEITHRREPVTPRVTLIISCYNEADVIREKLNNSLALDYPEGQLGIVVVSDGSDDETDDVVREFCAQGVRLIRQEGRLGKTMGLNLAMEDVDTEIVIFSDANAMYAPDAIKQLVSNFADPRVGYAVGAALYTDGDAGASARNENLYWRYELAIKSMESRLSSVVGGDGAIYGIRSRLWQPLQQADINDFVNPLQIVAQGYRGVFDAQARCYEETAGDFEREIARKERIVNRSIRGLMRVQEVLNPLEHGVFSFQVVSHKLLRWLIPVFLLIGVVGSVLISFLGGTEFLLVCFAAGLILLLALTGHIAADKHSLPFWISTPYYFVMVNLYAVRGILRAVRGKTQVTWSSARPEKELR
nr:glycosyltransferase family 2 protein [uncultured Marinobacter sp.]